MKAAVAKAFKEPLSIEQVEVPAIGPRDVLVKIDSCGVCHTDMHACHGDWPVKPSLPLIPGHEGVGTVVQAGEQVTHLTEGDRVGIPWLHSACGHCDYCLEGQETLCPEQQNSGYSVDGGYAEYCKAPADYVVEIPDELTFSQAAPLFCAGVTTYKALKVAEIKAGDYVAVVGAGGLGHLAIQYAKAMGYNVVAVDTGEEKLALAKELGASLTVDFAKESPSDAIQQKLGGVHAVICTAASKAAFEQSYRALRRGGSCVLVGLPPEEMPIPIFDTVLNGIKIIGSIVGTRKDLKECLQFAAEGKVKSIVEERSLDDINEIFAQMEQGDINGRIVMKIAD